MTGSRPRPPGHFLDGGLCIGPSEELAEWAIATFVAEEATLRNDDHAHLRSAEVGFLWTNVANTRQGRRILGEAEVGRPRGTMGKWPRARAEAQLLQWFGAVPDFLVTIDARYAADCEDAEFCALVEHELYHCGQERDEFGAPKFTKWGQPVFGMRGHDIEEFVGVVRRYGASAAGVQDLIDAAKHKPEVARANISQACGTCALRAA